MNSNTKKLAAALRNVDEFCQAGLNSEDPEHREAALGDILDSVREALADHDRETEAKDRADYLAFARSRPDAFERYSMLYEFGAWDHESEKPETREEFIGRASEQDADDESESWVFAPEWEEHKARSVAPVPFGRACHDFAGLVRRHLDRLRGHRRGRHLSPVEWAAFDLLVMIEQRATTLGDYAEQHPEAFGRPAEHDAVSGETWTHEDHERAAAEGWVIALNSETERDDIQRRDESRVFDSDESAVLHVYGKAREGSELHARALRLSLAPPADGADHV